MKYNINTLEKVLLCGSKLVSRSVVKFGLKLLTRQLIRPFWLNGWMFVYELNACGCDYRCSHLTSSI